MNWNEYHLNSKYHMDSSHRMNRFRLVQICPESMCNSRNVFIAKCIYDMNNPVRDMKPVSIKSSLLVRCCSYSVGNVTFGDTLCDKCHFSLTEIQDSPGASYWLIQLGLCSIRPIIIWWEMVPYSKTAMSLSDHLNLNCAIGQIVFRRAGT